MCFHHYDDGMLDACYNHELALYNSVVDSYHISDLDGINTITAQTYLIFTQLLCILDLVEKAVPGTPLSDDDMAECAPSTLKDDPDIAAKLIELDIPRQTPPPTPIVVVINCLATQPDCLAETQAISDAQDAEFTEGGVVPSSFENSLPEPQAIWGVRCWGPWCMGNQSRQFGSCDMTCQSLGKSCNTAEAQKMSTSEQMVEMVNTIWPTNPAAVEANSGVGVVWKGAALPESRGPFCVPRSGQCFYFEDGSGGSGRPPRGCGDGYHSTWSLLCYCD